MNDPARADFQDDQHVQGAERRRDVGRDVDGQVAEGKEAHRAGLIISQISQGAPISDANRPSGSS